MSNLITTPVGQKKSGKESINKPQDVAAVRQLLNQVPKFEGGTKDQPLPENTICDPALIKAIRSFQIRHFGVATGRVNPDDVTLSKLVELSSGNISPDLPRAFPSALHIALIQGTRQKIREIAKAEADAQRVPPVGGGKRTDPAARRLKEYFSVFPEFSQPDSEFYKKLPGGTHWCGVFGAWVLKQAGIPVKWVWRKGIYLLADDQKLATHKDSNYTVGDICLVKENPDEPFPTHHFIVAGEPENGMFPTVEGNYMGGGVVNHRRGTGEYEYYAVLEPRSL